MAVDIETLNAIGRVWPTDETPTHIAHERFTEAVETVTERLALGRAPSVLLIGEAGVGKTTLARAIGHRLQRKGWVIFEATARDLIAGQMYVGQIEERLQELIGAAGEPKVLWYAPQFHEMAYAGRYQYNPISVLDQLLPLMERGTVRVLGEAPSGTYERLAAQYPRLRIALETVEIKPMPEAETLALAERWADDATKPGTSPLADAALLREALVLAHHYLPGLARPGALLHLLRLARAERDLVNPSSPARLTLDDCLATLVRLTGLPIHVLDDREGLDLEALAAHFRRRVIGQEEAVRVLVDRIAMVKAGLVDPSRPYGVFLFAGPTGTGKTELAKTLADYLFGSEEHLLRLDMSELQTADTLDRILGETGVQGSGQALVDQVRKQPFSVLLLDEFEKAAPQVWDIFLQVFDDGRLTDRQGNTVDFRHTIVIMTSNLGAAVQTAPGLGFGAPVGPRFDSSLVEKSLAEVFRPEFLNRIDRVVVFSPLSRATMRALLKKELKAVLDRRGLRRRPWAVEWDESAIAFLLDAGFTPDLGARPLKRAIERHLLAPLSRTIVSHTAPEGDQFLFIRAGAAGLEVEFVDPDADAFSAVTEAEAQRSLEAVVLAPYGTAEEMGLLHAVYDRLCERVEHPDWSATKTALLGDMADPEFWTREDRFATLGRAEHMDRIETGLATAERLIERLTGGGRTSFPAGLVGRLAQQLYLLGEALAAHEADEPRDAFLLVEAEPADRESARRIGGMYRQWADARRMRWIPVLDEHGASGPYRLLVSVSGFGAYRILKPETGLHIFERQETGRTRRVTVRVRVAPHPERPALDEEALRDQARTAVEGPERLMVVRRYVLEPSPLALDKARGWRTGRLDDVLAGAFDLFRPKTAEAESS